MKGARNRLSNSFICDITLFTANLFRFYSFEYNQVFISAREDLYFYTKSSIMEKLVNVTIFGIF